MSIHGYFATAEKRLHTFRRACPVNILRLSVQWAAVLAIICIAGCASLLSSGEPPTRMVLSPQLPKLTKQYPNTAKKQLVVSLPLADQAVDTDSIALLFNDREVRYLAGVRWVSRAPRIVQRSLIDAFSSTGALLGVADEGVGLAAHLRLYCDLREFTLHYSAPDQPPTAVVSVAVRLVNLDTGEVIGSLLSTERAQATGTSNESLVEAMENALSAFLSTAVPWTLERINTTRLR